MRTPRFARPLLATLLLCAALAPAARAGDGDAVLVPDVVGKSAAEATAALEGAALKVVPVEIAEGTAGRVHSQVPPAGAYVPQGAEVEIRIGTALRIQTQAPDLVGKTLDEAVEAYGSAYVIEVEDVDGDAAEQGKILDQDPRPGEALLFRGVLRLFAVQEAAPASVVVPSTLGKTETEARALIADAGLSVSVTYVQDPVAGPGIVVSQDPPCCGEILAGGLVALRVNGEPPEEPEGDVAMPDVVGLTMTDASQAVLLAGLAPQVAFEVRPGEPGWRCVAQDPAPGAPVPYGDAVKLVVSLPSSSPAQVRVPPLQGLQAADAVSVLGLLGLQAQVTEQSSLYTPGRVFAQSPAAGTYVPPGAAVAVRVAKTPPGGWTPAGIQVPSVLGLPPAAAFVKLLAAGLWGLEKHHVSPGVPLGVVDAQNPAPGSVVGPGTIVTFYVPKPTTVPALVGASKAAALQKLLQAGLNGAAQGPAFGIGSTKVTSQSIPAGTQVAQGTTIQFLYVYTGGPGPVKVKVPALVGKTKAQAALLLQAKGLNGQFVGPLFGVGTTQVTSQSPPPNTLVLQGSAVIVKFQFTGGPPATQVQVPNLLGLTRTQAVQALQAKGLGVSLSGPAFGVGATQVTWQDPVGGALVAPGTVVKAKYVYGGGVQPVKVTVPALIGLTKLQAAAALQAKGLNANVLGPPIGVGVPKVVAQAPPAGTLVNTGSAVNVTIQWSLGGGGNKVQVPNLQNLSKAQALGALQAKGLVPDFQGPAFGLGTTKVVGQNPAPGALVNVGSTVKVTYVFTGPGMGVGVKVPPAVGKTRAQAKALVEGKGLVAKFVGPIFGVGVPTVVNQAPPAGSTVAPGTQVTLVIQFK